MRSFFPRINAACLRFVVVLALAALPLTRALDARGQGTSAAPVNVDSILAALDTIPRPLLTFVPSYSARMRGNVSSVGWTNRFTNQSQFGSRGTLTIGLDTDRTDYRLQDRLEEKKSLTGRLGYNIRRNLTSSVNFTDSRQFNRVIAAVGGLQDFRLNNRVVDGSVNYNTRVFRDVRVDGRVNGRLSNSEQTFKNDRSATTGINGGMGYTMLNRRATVRIRGAYVKTTASSTTGTSSEDALNGLGGSVDSVVTLINVHVSDSLSLAFDYTNFESDRFFADQARGSSGARQPGSENVIREHELRRNRNWGVTLDAEPRRGLRLGVKFRQTDQLQDFDNNNTRDSHTISNNMNIDINYAPRRGTSLNLRLKNSFRTYDFGALSLNGRDQISKSISLGIRHTFTTTMNAELTLSNSIDQAKYVRNVENPRDRDQVDASANLRLSSRPFGQLGVDVVVTAWITDYVNIDKSLSKDNRRKEKYDLRTSMSYTITENTNLRQEYGLAIEFTDHTFRAADNFLDRNIRFSNGLTTKLTGKTNIGIDYALRLHDKGSYVPPTGGGERVLVVQTEDRNDRLETRLEYKINPHVRAEVRHDYSRRFAENISSGRTTVRTETGIEAGLIGNYNVGRGGKFNFNIKKVNRAGDFVSERQKNYWLISSEFRYAF